MEATGGRLLRALISKDRLTERGNLQLKVINDFLDFWLGELLDLLHNKQEVLSDFGALRKSLLVAAVIVLKKSLEDLLIVLHLREAEGGVSPLDGTLSVFELLAQLVHQLLRLPVLVDVREQVFGDVLKLVPREVSELLGKARDGLREQIVDDVVGLGMQLVKEELDLVPNLFLFILQKHADVNYLAFEFEHVVEDQVSDHHEGLPPDRALGIVKENKHVLGLLVEDVWEAIEKVTHRYDDVVLDTEVNVGLQQGEEEVDVGCADLGRDTHELAKRQYSRSLKDAHLGSQDHFVCS